MTETEDSNSYIPLEIPEYLKPYTPHPVLKEGDISIYEYKKQELSVYYISHEFKRCTKIIGKDREVIVITSGNKDGNMSILSNNYIYHTQAFLINKKDISPRERIIEWGFDQQIRILGSKMTIGISSDLKDVASQTLDRVEDCTHRHVIKFIIKKLMRGEDL